MKSLHRLLKKTYLLLSREDKKNTLALLIATLISSVTEIAGIFLIIPLLNSYSSGSKNQVNSLSVFNLSSYSAEHIFHLSIALLLSALTLRLYTRYLTFKLSQLIGLSLHRRALNAFIQSDFYTQRHLYAKNLPHCLNIQINQVVTSVIVEIINGISSLIILAMFGAMSLAIYPGLTIALITVLSIIYMIILQLI